MKPDIKNTMILVKGKDKTYQISGYKYNSKSSRWEIQYNGNLTIYKYHPQNIIILNRPRIVDISNHIVYIKGAPTSKVSQVLNFGKRMRIIFESGASQTIIPSEFSLIRNQANNPKIKQTLQYLKEIASYTNDSDSEEAFLKKEMERLTFINSESILYHYLNGSQPKSKSLDIGKVIFPFRYNLSQKMALEKALTNPISIIDGPPETGKTQTILNLIANLVAVYGKSVAVVSGNNEAIKNVVEKMQKQNYGFLLAMLGNNKNQETFFNDLPVAAVHDWNHKESENELQQKLKKLNTKLNKLLEVDRKRAEKEAELQQWELEQEHFSFYFKQQDIHEIEKLPLFWATPERILAFLADSYICQETEKAKNFFFRIKVFIKYGVKDYNQLCQDDMQLLLSLQKQFYQKQIIALKKQLKLLESKLENVSFEELLQEHQLLSEQLLQKYLYVHYKPIKKNSYTIRNFKAQFNDFIKTYPVILSTTHSLRRSIPENYLLDYVIIDEASQVDIITGVLALSCCRNVIIVGDEKQLPQIISDGAKKQIKADVNQGVYNYFENSILSSVIKLYDNKIARTILKEHYRCHPLIIGYCNQKYYNQELIPFTNSEISDTPLLIYETVEGNHMRQITRGKKGSYNQRELDVTIKEVLENSHDCRYEDIGFVTPFRLQANKGAEVLDRQIESDTVHKYQGREKDLMIMSTVLDDTWAGKKGMKFVDDDQLINVAVSRAIKQFILVTNRNFFLKQGGEIADLIRYMEYSTLDDNVINSRIVSVFDLLYKSYSVKLMPLKRKINDNARFKSEEIIRVVLEELLESPSYSQYAYSQNVFLRNLIRDTSFLNEAEVRYINNRASLDFVIFKKIGKTCSMIIEVDGFEYHENNPVQQKRDEMKDSILEKCQIPLLRLRTNDSGIVDKVKNKLNSLM